MAGAQFEYDKSGGTSYYFITTFFALVLIPTTYYFWPRRRKRIDEIIEKCHCNGCQLKFNSLNAIKPKNDIKNFLIKLTLILIWIIFIYVSYHAAKVERDYNEYDPYAILELDKGSSIGEIKKKYRQLSALYHPDVKDTGDSLKFMKIAKAYAALTDEESRKNWEEFGNPDGPGATTFGIALPAWIVEKGNSIWVLSAYILVFMIILPIIVGTWWYKSIKYSGDKVLLDTTQMYMYFFHKTPNMILRRVLMILAASFEFCKFYNTEVQERPSDNIELPQLLKTLTNLNEKNKEKPLSAPYSVKSRILIHAHLSRLELPAHTLEIDKQYILKKCPILLNEMVTCVAQLMAFANSGRIQHSPKLETMENIMKTSQMIVQALWEYKSPLLQLPHVGDDILKHCINKKFMVRNIRDIQCMREFDRRALLSKLSEREYSDIMYILSMMPHVDMDIVTKVIDDEDPNTITANSIVTVTVTLHRKSLGSLIKSGESRKNREKEYNLAGGDGKVVAFKPDLLANGSCLPANNEDTIIHRDQQQIAEEPFDEDDETQQSKKQPAYKPKKKGLSKSMVAKQKAKKKTAQNQAKAKPGTQSTSIDNTSDVSKPNEKVRTNSISSSTSSKISPKEERQDDKEETRSQSSNLSDNEVEEIRSKKKKRYVDHKKGEINEENEASAGESDDVGDGAGNFSSSENSTSSSSSDTDIYSSQDERPGTTSKRRNEIKEALALATLDHNDGCYDSCDSVGGIGGLSGGLKHQIAPLTKSNPLPKNTGSKVIVVKKDRSKQHTSPGKDSLKSSEPKVGSQENTAIKKMPTKAKTKNVSTNEDCDKELELDEQLLNNKPKEDEEDELWDEDFQKTLRKHEKLMLEGNKKKETFEVHCPYFPDKKYERWWLYMADRKHGALITAPIYVSSLKDNEEFQLKFPAPPKPGIYAFTVVLRSDSYLDCDFTKLVKLDVKEEKVMDENHPQWDISDTEKEEDDEGRGETGDFIGGDDDDQSEDGGENEDVDTTTTKSSSRPRGKTGLFGALSNALMTSGKQKVSDDDDNETKNHDDHEKSADVVVGEKPTKSKTRVTSKLKSAAGASGTSTSKKSKNLSDMEYTTEESSSDEN